MFSNGITLQTHTGNTLLDAEATYHQERMLEAARDASDARQAKQARSNTRTAKASGPRGLDRLRSVLHRVTSGAAAAR